MSSLAAARPRPNRLLAALPAEEHKQLLARTEQVDLALGQTLYDPGGAIDYIYFPETAVASLLSTMENGDTVEVGPVGHEGMVGLHAFLGVAVSPDHAVVHVAGTLRRMRVADLRAEVRRGEALARLLLRYTRLLFVLSTQTSACHKHHLLTQQLARWLLLMHDYAGGDELRLTQDLIARTLGVRRSGVTVAAGAFQTAGLLDYTRGVIRVADRAGLEATACECYDVIRREYDDAYADYERSGTGEVRARG